MNVHAPRSTPRAARWRACRVWLSLLTLVCVSARPLAAQGTGTDAPSTHDARSPRLTCFRGQPLPACQRFVLTELGFLRNVATSSRPTTGYDGSVIPGLRDKDHASEILLELGMMQNRGPKHAIGGVLVLGPDVGAKFRYRRWLDTSGVALDVGAGVVRERRYRSQGAALVADAALNFSDYGAIVLRGSASQRDGRLATGMHAGARLGSKPAVIGGTALALAFGLLFAALASAWDE